MKTGPFSFTVEETRSNQCDTTVWVWFHLVYSMAKLIDNNSFIFLLFRKLNISCIEISSHAFLVMALWFWAECDAPRQLQRESTKLIFVPQNTVSRLYLHSKWTTCFWNSNACFSSHFNATPTVLLVTNRPLYGTNSTCQSDFRNSIPSYLLHHNCVVFKENRKRE